MAERWREIAGRDQVTRGGRAASYSRTTRTSVMPRLFEEAGAAGARITEINVAEPNLETVFLHLTGRALRD